MLWEAQATWIGYRQVFLSKAQLMSSWKPASADNHVKKPSWMSSPVESSHESTSSCHLPTTVWKTPSQNYLAELSQSTEPWEAKVNICVKPSGLGVACHIAMDNWNTLRALYSYSIWFLSFIVVTTAVAAGFLPDYLINDLFLNSL